MRSSCAAEAGARSWIGAIDEPPFRLLGVKIASGYSSEAHVFANLLRHRGTDYDARVIYDDWTPVAEADRGHADRFRSAAGVRLMRAHAGFRPNPDGRRPLHDKVRSRLLLHAAIPGMVRAARSYRPDVVYSSQQKLDCYAASVIARRLGVPQIIHLHYAIGPWLGKQTLHQLTRCSHVVAVSDFMRRDAIRHGVPPDRVTTIHNAISPFPESGEGIRVSVRAELNIPRDARVLGIVARLDPSKGHADTIDAFARLAGAHDDAWLVIVGAGALRETLEEQARATGVSERIVFTGHRVDVPRILSALDVFVHPTRREPFGLSLLESAAAGLSSVAYDEGAAREIVVHGDTGLLAPAGDIAALTSHMEALVRRPDLRRRAGEAARRRVALSFDPEAAGRRFGTLVRKVAASAGVARPTLVPGTLPAAGI